jgi:hypothetical protein
LTDVILLALTEQSFVLDDVIHHREWVLAREFLLRLGTRDADDQSRNHR